jgi:hypothetical protein
MNLPSGLIFFLDFKYGSAQGGEGQFAGKSLFGGTNTTGSSANFGRTNSPVNGLYGEGRYGYSINDSVASVSGCVVATGSLVGIGYDSAVSASAGLNLRTIAVPLANLASADVEAVRAFAITGSSIAEVYPQFTVVSGTNVVFYVKHNPAASGATITAAVDFVSTPANNYSRGDFEDSTPNSAGNTTTGLDIPEIDLELKSEAIVAKTRKLKAVWTPELAQDLNAYHSIDAEAELTSMLSDYISLEIDLEILDMLKANALTTDYWSAKVGEEYSNGSWSLGTNTLAYQKNTWFQTLGVKLNKVSNKIHQLTLRGGANFIVASPDVCTILESIPGFVVNADKDAMQFAAGVTAVGSMSNRYTVYKNPYMTSNEILMGYRS